MAGPDIAWLRMDRPTNLMMITSVMMFDEVLTLDEVKALIDGFHAEFEALQEFVKREGACREVSARHPHVLRFTPHTSRCPGLCRLFYA